MLAAVFGHEEIVSLLLAAGADTSLKDERGLTAHEWSIRRGFPIVAQLIARASASRQPATPAAPRKPTPVIEHRQPKSVDQDENERETSWQSHSAPPPPERTSTPKMGGAAAAILRNHVARSAQESRDLKPLPDAELLEPVVIFSKGQRESPETEIEPEVADDSATRVEPQPPVVVAPEMEAPAFPTSESELTTTQTAAEAAVGFASVQTNETANETAYSELGPEPSPSNDNDPEQTNPSLAPVFNDGAGASVANATSNAPESFDQEQPTLVPSTAEAHQSSVKSTDEDTTLFPVETVRTSVPPAFLTNSPPSTSGRPIIWLLVVVTLGASAFGAYHLNNYFFATTPAAAPVVQVTQPAPVAPPAKPAPVIAGDLAGAELDVPEPDYPPNLPTSAASITVRVQVNRRGKVVSARSGEGDSSLRAAAVDAARKATFSPEKLAGSGRVITGTITYNFQPRPASSPAPASSPSDANAQPSAADESTPVTGGRLAGAETNLPAAEYPASAVRQRVEETITITVRVNRAGRVISWKTGTGNAALRAAALKAAKRATFSPDKLPAGNEVVGTITYNFKL